MNDLANHFTGDERDRQRIEFDPVAFQVSAALPLCKEFTALYKDIDLELRQDHEMAKLSPVARFNKLNSITHMVDDFYAIVRENNLLILECGTKFENGVT